VNAMSLVPALCLSCSRVSLVSLAQARSGELTCPRCGGDARVSPSCSYPESEREVFGELSEVVIEAKISRAEAGGYAETVRQALWSGRYPRELERLCGRMPGLLPLQITAGSNAEAQRGTLGKLQTILQALASAPRESVEYSLVAEPTPSHTSER